MTEHTRVYVEGIEFDDVDLPTAVKLLFDCVGKGGLVVTPNVDHLQRYRIDPQLRTVYDAAALRLADGAPVVALARLAGKHLSRVTGADLFPAVLKEAAVRGCRVAVVGMPSQAAADELRRSMLNKFDTLTVVAISPPFGFEDDEEERERLADEVARFAPHIVFACLGSPKQELWAKSVAPRLPRTVFVGAGASALYFAGYLRRAPRWGRTLGLEWAFRLASEPARLWPRYASNARYLAGASARQMRLRLRR